MARRTLRPMPAHPPASIAVFNEGWKSHERRLLDVIRPLTVEQLQLRPAAEHWTVWQLASNMVGGRGRSRGPRHECLERWAEEDPLVEYSRRRGEKSAKFTRAWVIWHLVQHELQHGAEIAIILRSHGLPTLDL
ncbi:hypothetical protein BH18ACT5_BH18ACT5_01700 [soil metagenome]